MIGFPVLLASIFTVWGSRRSATFAPGTNRVYEDELDEIAEVESMTDAEMAGVAANRKCTYMAATVASTANDTQSRAHVLLRLLRTVRRLVPAQAVNSLHCIAPLKVIQPSLRTSCPQTVILINHSLRDLVYSEFATSVHLRSFGSLHPRRRSALNVCWRCCFSHLAVA